MFAVALPRAIQVWFNSGLITKDLRALARARLRDAQVLLQDKRFDGAFYLCGYAVEIALKARICRTLKWPDFPETRNAFKELESLKTHDLDVLLHFSGVEGRVKAKHLADWSMVVKWNPEKRYQAIGRVPPQQAVDMVTCREALEDSVIDTGVLRKAMHEIAELKGDFTLFALFRREDAPSTWGTWDLVVAAPWLESGKLKALGELVDLLARSIGRESLSQFSRVETVPSNNRTVKFILDKFPVDDGERSLQSTDLFDLRIEEAIILRAKRPSPNKPARKALHPAGAGPSRRRG